MCNYRVLFVDNSTASSMEESNSLSSIEKCLSSVILEGLNIFNEQVEIDQEVTADSHDVVVNFDSLMANTKQTARIMAKDHQRDSPIEVNQGERLLDICRL